MSRRRALRVTAIVAAILVAAGVVAGVATTVAVIRRPLPDRDVDVSLAGLGAAVSVDRDARGVPQIYADNPDDLFRVQGYLHAEDQFFQMDVRRHVTAGRLAELVGDSPDAIRADGVIRTLGWRRVAASEYATLDLTTRSYLESYADGVNDYLRGRSPSQLSVSYSILARAHTLPPIERWTPVDSLAWLKAMAWDLRGNYDEELARARTYTSVPDVARVDQLFPPYPYAQHPPILDSGAVTASPALSPAARTRRPRGTPVPVPLAPRAPDPDGLKTALVGGSAQRALDDTRAAVDAVPALGTGDDVGSNSWVVGGAYTATGRPLLANDPHLATSMPGVWYQSGLHCRVLSPRCPFDVAGFGFAGMPGVVIGHNRTVAWGLTNLSPDVTDFYLERITGNTVEVDGKQRPLTVRKETIKVAGAPDVPLTIRSTVHGPVISDVLESVARAGAAAPVPGDGERSGINGTYAVSLAWTALVPGHAVEAIFGLDRAADFGHFRAAALLLDTPAQNIVYADAAGNIGYQAPGRIPVRGPGRADSPVPVDGTWPHPGWDSAYDWKGTVPTSRLPWVENPPEGYLVAANQAVTGPNGPVRMTTDWDYGFRAQRIRDLLSAWIAQGHPMTVGDMRSMQADTRNGMAAVLVPLLLKTDVSDGFTEQAVNLLRNWDYGEPVDSAAAAYFNVVWATLLNLTFSDELPEGFRPDGGDRWFQVVTDLLAKPHDRWWDDRRTPDVVESRDEVLRRALSQARLQLTSTLGKDPDRWEWGRLHRVRLEQLPLGGEGSPWFVHLLVNRGPYEAPGGSSIVNAFGWDAASGNFDVNAAPSMRMVVDLADLDSSRWVNQTGISGHPLDDHYDDQVGTWLAGGSYPWPFSAAAVTQASRTHQEFRATGTVNGRTATSTG